MGGRSGWNSVGRILERRELNCMSRYRILKGNVSLMKREMEAIKKDQMELLEKKIQYQK